MPLNFSRTNKRQVVGFEQRIAVLPSHPDASFSVPHVDYQTDTAADAKRKQLS